MRKQIIAWGGLGTNRRLLVEQYLLAQLRGTRPRVCFVPTASGDADWSIDRFYRGFEKLGARASHLPLFVQKKKHVDLARLLSSQDAVYVGGGNTRNMLLLWKAWGVTETLRRAYERGVVLSGWSAGALCWFDGGLTDSFGPYAPMRALGWLSGSFCPHFDSESSRRAIYRRLIREGALAGGYAADDGVGLHFFDGRLHRVVASRKNARARFITRARGRLVESVCASELISAM